MDKKKILIVDDEKDALFVLDKELTAKGYSVIAANKGREALSLALSQHPDLVILDICMPDMDGTEVAMKLKENPQTQDIPVIFLTCLVQREEEAGQGHMVGGKVVIAKPYDIEDLSEEIERLVGQQSVPS